MALAIRKRVNSRLARDPQREPNTSCWGSKKPLPGDPICGMLVSKVPFFVPAVERRIWIQSSDPGAELNLQLAYINLI